jgi:uncharacterized protein (DUF2267 family)
MAGSDVRSINKTIQNTMEWLHGIKAELGWEDDERVYEATRAVLHAIRDRLPVEDAVQFSAQLPILLKGVFFDQYDPTGKPLKVRTKEEFYELVRSDFDGFLNAEEAVEGVLRGMRHKLPEESFNDVRDNMPEGIRDLFKIRIRVRSRTRQEPRYAESRRSAPSRTRKR